MSWKKSNKLEIPQRHKGGSINEARKVMDSFLASGDDMWECPESDIGDYKKRATWYMAASEKGCRFSVRGDTCYIMRREQ